MTPTNPQVVDAAEDGQQEDWQPGSSAHFEYHCLESPTSADWDTYLRSHQAVTVLHRNTDDEQFNGTTGWTRFERAAEGCPATYRVRWADGYEADVFEDELLTDPTFWYRPDPPPAGGGRPGVGGAA